MNPQSLGGASDPNAMANSPNPADPYGCQQNPGSAVCQNCTINPGSPTCQALAQGQRPEQGTAGFSTASQEGGDENSFDVGSADPYAGGAPNLASTSQTQAGRAPEQHTIPNGGGQMPGGGDSRPATLDAQRRGGAGTPLGNVADIERGLMAGGYSGNGGPGDVNEGGGFGGYGKGGPGENGRGPTSVGMDLKKYLPGHAMAPAMRIGGDGMLAPDINGKSADLFKKISARIQVKCKLGALRDCR
jgi:hypothetical protein